MKLKAMMTAGAAALVMGSAGVHAASYTGNVAVATDYVFRGISQTQERPAIQGGFDAAFDSGIFLGTWASNVNFGTDASTEMDFYGGYAGTFGCSSCSYKVGYYFYDYDGDPQFDYSEVAASVTYGGLTVGMNYSWEYLGEGTTDAIGNKVDFYYPYVNYTYALPWWDLSLALHVGQNIMSDDGVFEPDEDKYTDWSVGLSRTFKEMGGITFGLTYWDTTVDDLFGVNADDADARVVFSASKAL
jgi:uncharacterized protein (TIGR02001 family)